MSSVAVNIILEPALPLHTQPALSGPAVLEYTSALWEDVPHCFARLPSATPCLESDPEGRAERLNPRPWVDTPISDKKLKLPNPVGYLVSMCITAIS